MNDAEKARLEELLEKVQKPAQYIGGEMNAVQKPWDSVKTHFAFCFPDTYEIAMSHLGMKILYHLINGKEDAACERVCMPCADMADLMRKENVPLFSLESRAALNHFEIIGFTLQYEMSFTNILEMLDLGRVPVLAADRTEGDPIVVAGGPCAFNPEPLTPFIDAFMIGDGEDVMHELVDCIRDGREAGKPRLDILRALAGLEGVYVPCLYEATYHEDGTLASFSPTDPAAPAVVKKRVVKDLSAAIYPDSIPVPYTEIVHDRMVLEIMRGCTRGCRFCQAGVLYRPVRERSMERLLELADKLQKSTGYEEMSLSSLSSGDYSCLPELIRALMDQYKDKRVSVSLPSMRIDNIVKQSLEETQKVKKSGLTLAPEAGTQRLRDVINKREALFHDGSAHGNGRGLTGHRPPGQKSGGRLLRPAQGKTGQGRAGDVLGLRIRAQALHPLPVGPPGHHRAGAGKTGGASAVLKAQVRQFQLARKPPVHAGGLHLPGRPADGPGDLRGLEAGLPPGRVERAFPVRPVDEGL